MLVDAQPRTLISSHVWCSAWMLLSRLLRSCTLRSSSDSESLDPARNLHDSSMVECMMLHAAGPSKQQAAVGGDSGWRKLGGRLHYPRRHIWKGC